MSTRATIKIKRGDELIRVYHHSDGYPEGVGVDLKNYLDGLKNWIPDRIANHLVKNGLPNLYNSNVIDKSYEVTISQHGDEEYGYLIDCDNKQLKCYALGWDEYDWKESKLVEIPSKTTQDADKENKRIATPYTDETGKTWVHVEAGDIDFLLDIKKLTDKELNYDEAMQLAKDNDMVLPEKRWWSLVNTFLEEVNQVIRDLGGDILDDIYWSSSQYSGSNAWNFIATIGTLGNNCKMLRIGVRGSRAFKKS